MASPRNESQVVQSGKPPLGPDPNSLPLEVFEAIIGTISFVDLPHFVQTSKAIYNGYLKTRYRTLLESITKEDAKQLESLLSRFPKSWHHWTTHQILNKYTDPHCDNCNAYGYIFLWCCVPVMKLCECCISLPQFRFVDFNTALARYGYKRWEVSSLPTIYGLYGNFSADTRIILRYMLMSEEERRGEQELEQMDHFFPFVRQWPASNWFLTGCMRVSQTLEKSTGRKLRELMCGQCPFSPEEEANRRALFHIPTVRVYRTSVPRSYEHLEEHIIKHHPSLLEHYQKGWQCLTEGQRHRFLFPDSHLRPEVLPGVPLQQNPPIGIHPGDPVIVHVQPGPLLAANGQPMPGLPLPQPPMASSPSQPLLQAPSTWITWNFFVFADKYTVFSQLSPAINYIDSKMEHVGHIHGFPAVPSGHGDISKNSLAWRAVNECLERAKTESWEYLKGRIDKEGIQVVKQILDGEPVLKDLVRMKTEDEEETAGSERTIQNLVPQDPFPALPTIDEVPWGWQ